MGIFQKIADAIASQAAAEAHAKMTETYEQLEADLTYAIEKAVERRLVRGCICPPTAEATCASFNCPRRKPLNLTSATPFTMYESKGV